MRPIILALLGAAVVFAQARTIWDGVYTAGQAERGKAGYEIHCQTCHARDLSGGSDGDDPAPALIQKDFARNRKDLNNLYTYIRASMPRDEPGKLDGPTAIDIVAYLLQRNSFPPGSAELPADSETLRQISTRRNEP